MTENQPDKRFNNPFMALRHKNFRIYWLGMCVSLIGTWMQNTAQPWLAYSLTDSPLLLSLVGALQFLPVLLFSIFAGVIIDRFPKKNILFITQSTSLVITLCLAVLVWSGYIQYWHILVAATALGFVNTFDMPTRQAFVIEMVGKEDLSNAIALNSSVFNIARILGPALAGIIMGYMGIAACFYINSISFAAIIIALFFIHPMPLQRAQDTSKKMKEDIKDGLLYLRQNPLLLKTLSIVLIVATFAMNYTVLVPVFTKTVLGREELEFGLLMSAMGIGSFLGAMFIAAISRHGPKKLILILFPFMIAALLVLSGFVTSYFLMALCLAATGFFFVAFSSSANSALQLNTQNEYRGRVMSMYVLVFGGSTPIGNLFAGVITDHFGPAAGFISCGAMIFVFALLLFAFIQKKEKID